MIEDVSLRMMNPYPLGAAKGAKVIAGRDHSQL